MFCIVHFVLFIIALYLVPSVANVYELSSLVCDCSVSCAQCCQCMDCPVLFLIALYLVPSVANVYELSSLVCDRSVSRAQCCQCLWIVQSCLWPLCILYPVLPVSMNCPVLFVIVLCLVPSVANVYELCSLFCDRSVYCVQCCQCLWIVQSWLWPVCILCPVLPMSMNCPVLFVTALYLVPSVANVYELTSLVCDQSASCAQCCQCLWIVQSCLWPLCILCPVLPVSMNCPVLFVIVLCLVPSVANVYELSSLVCDCSVSCAQCCQCLWIVQSFLWPLCILCPVLPMSIHCLIMLVTGLYLVPSVANFYELSSLVCDRSVSCAHCCQCLWIVQSCSWSFCILCSALPMSMDCPVSIALLTFSNV